MRNVNKDDLIEMYLGTSSPDEFDSLAEINDYFSQQSLIEMFGIHSYDEKEAEMAKEVVIEEWEKTRSEKRIQKFANAFARQHGWGRATEITISNKITEPEIGETQHFGWRKNTTGEYVSNAYRQNFGWKNTFYQPAQCEVIIPKSIVKNL